jgi:hypothetical protein
MSGSWGAQLIGSGTLGGTATGAAVDCPGGLMVFAVVASAWNGATVSLMVLGPDGNTYILATSGAFTANGMLAVYLPPCQIQAQVSGGPPAGVFASIARVVS